MKEKILDFLKEKIDQVTIKEAPNLFNKTQTLIHEIGNDLDGDFISYWGADNSNISRNDSLVFSEILGQKPKEKRLYIFVKSNGGSGEAVLRIIHLLRQQYEEIIVMAPLSCASAATMMALGADKIMMGPLSYLTAVDTSITHDLSPLDIDKDLVSVSQNELDRVLKLWNNQKRKKGDNPYVSLYEHIHPLVFGAVDRASSLSIKLTNEILSYHMQDEAKINTISEHLNAEYPSHAYPITYKEAERIGLKVELLDADLNDKLIQLNHLYSEMAQRHDSNTSAYKYYTNQIYTIIESEQLQIHYKLDKKYIWRKEDQEWITTKDNSSWRKIDHESNQKFYIR